MLNPCLGIRVLMQREREKCQVLSFREKRRVPPPARFFQEGSLMYRTADLVRSQNLEFSSVALPFSA